MVLLLATGLTNFNLTGFFLFVLLLLLFNSVFFTISHCWLSFHCLMSPYIINVPVSSTHWGKQNLYYDRKSRVSASLKMMTTTGLVRGITNMSTLVIKENSETTSAPPNYSLQNDQKYQHYFLCVVLHYNRLQVYLINWLLSAHGVLLWRVQAPGVTGTLSYTSFHSWPLCVSHTHPHIPFSTSLALSLSL